MYNTAIFLGIYCKDTTEIFLQISSNYQFFGCVESVGVTFSASSESSTASRLLSRSSAWARDSSWAIHTVSFSSSLLKGKRNLTMPQLRIDTLHLKQLGMCATLNYMAILENKNLVTVVDST